MDSLRRTVLDTIPFETRMKLRLAVHNARARSRGNRDIVSLIARHEGGRWSIDDGVTKLFVPSVQRWRRYRHGVDQGIAGIAGVYRIGAEVEISPGDLVIDVGANVGEVTIACARAGATVHSFEAEPSTYSLLAANAGVLDRVHLNELAVSDHAGTITFFVDPDDADSSTIEPYSGAPSITVDCVTLDEYAQREGIGAVHLLKCDAEGAEPEVLAGASDVLDRTTWAAIDCGAERHGTTTIAPVRATLEAHGFDVTEHVISEQRVVLLGHRPS